MDQTRLKTQKESSKITQSRYRVQIKSWDWLFMKKYVFWHTVITTSEGVYLQFANQLSWFDRWSQCVPFVKLFLAGERSIGEQRKFVQLYYWKFVEKYSKIKNMTKSKISLYNPCPSSSALLFLLLSSRCSYFLGCLHTNYLY